MIKCKNNCPLGKFDGCCQCCPENKGCPEVCEYEPGSCGEATLEQYGITKFESDVLNLTYVAPTVSHGIDTDKLKKKYPDAAADCAKDTPKAGYVKITLKDGSGKDG